MISGGSKAKCTWRDPLAVTRGCSLRNSRWSFTRGEISMCTRSNRVSVTAQIVGVASITPTGTASTRT